MVVIANNSRRNLWGGFYHPPPGVNNLRLSTTLFRLTAVPRPGGRVVLSFPEEFSLRRELLAPRIGTYHDMHLVGLFHESRVVILVHCEPHMTMATADSQGLSL